jgi:hypothetical protein
MIDALEVDTSEIFQPSNFPPLCPIVWQCNMQYSFQQLREIYIVQSSMHRDGTGTCFTSWKTIYQCVTYNQCSSTNKWTNIKSSQEE